MKKLELITALCVLSSVSMASKDTPGMTLCTNFNVDHDIDLVTTKDGGFITYSYAGHGKHCVTDLQDKRLDQIVANQYTIIVDNEGIAETCQGGLASSGTNTITFNVDGQPHCYAHSGT